MDPISHGLIGAGVAALSGQPFAWDNPVYLGSILGSMAPDLDIVMQTRGHIAYLKHHRGISHSIPGLLGFASLITLGLWLLFPGTQFWPLFAWTFAGALSHSVFDLLNSYGARLLWPFVKRRLSINFIMLTDPVILISFFLAFMHNNDHYNMYPLVFALSGLYLLLRWKSKRHVVSLLSEEFNPDCSRILVFPAMYRPFSWNFVVERQDSIITGTVPFYKYSLIIKDVLSKPVHPSIDTAEESPLGEIFRDFTPYYHVSHQWNEDVQVVTFSDLRYPYKGGFMYTGTAVLDQEGEILEAAFKPYTARKEIAVALGAK